MEDKDIAREAKKFSMDWHERGYEKGETQKFWRGLLKNVLQVAEPDKIIDFELPIKIEGQTKFIDAYISATKILIEQKSFGVELDKKESQSDGTFLTPFEQAERYADALPEEKKPRYIIVCNFSEFRIYNFTQNLFEPKLTAFKLRDLVYEYLRLEILINPNADDSSPQEKISKAALADIEKIYNAFRLNYEKNKVAAFEDALNKICTRLVFCLYAGDAKIFDTAKKTFDTEKFFGYISKFDNKEKIAALQKIFDVFSLDKNLRGNLDDELKNFPYINGGLFDEKISLPAYNRFITNPVATLENIKGIKNFRWREISPPIFGAMFESKFSTREEQREHGMFYTSVENIHKVIDPLFLDDLRGEFADIKRMQKKNRVNALFDFQDKIASLNFLDPACGSGNFLTETFLSLRRLENEIIEELIHLYADIPENPIKVSPRQFYGIEIDSFAAAVARLALSIADFQMKRETSWIIHHDLPELPLSKFVSVICANALRLDWKNFAPEINFIIGNPPFRGYSEQNPVQKADIRAVYHENRKAGKLDFVSGWYRKAAEFIQGTNIRCAFVSTNSIVQGEQCADVWKILYEKFNVHIDFCHQTFKWLSDSENMAHVHCVIVGFSSAPNPKPKKIFDGEKVSVVENINFYLTEGENFFVEAHNEHIQDGVPKMVSGNRFADGGNLIVEAKDLDYFLKNEPAAKKYIKNLIGTEEFINNKPRYCLWLKDFPLDEIKKFPLIDERVENCRQDRLKGAPDRQKLAKTPHLFRETLNPKSCLVIPSISSERRFYIPMGFIDENTIVTNRMMIIPSAQIYHFGILTSSIHMAWMRAVGGRFESRYSYLKNIVYNNFVWCSPTERQKKLIEETAQKILDVRADFPDWTFAKLYNEETMPDELRHAHKSNDYAVALAYGFEKFLEDEPRLVAELMKLYKALTKS